MWLIHTGIPAVSEHARVPSHTVDRAWRSLHTPKGEVRPELLAQALRQMEKVQPELAAWLRQTFERPMDDVARSIGASLAMLVWVSFQLHSRGLATTIKRTDCQEVEGLLRADEEMRRDNPKAMLESEDVVAAHQPALVQSLREQLDDAIFSHADEVDIDDVDRVYRVLLVEVLVLSYASASGDPSGTVASEGLS